MAMDVITRDPVSGLGAGVDANNNAKVALPRVKTQAGYAILATENDSGMVTGTPQIGTPFTSDDGRLSIGQDSVLMNHSFNVAAQNTANYRTASATMTLALGGGFITFNSSNTLTTATGCIWSTYRPFNLMGNAGLHFEFTGAITQYPLAGEVFDAGLFPFAAGGAAPTDGVYFRLTSAGLIGVLNYNGVEVQSGVLMLANAFTLNANVQFNIVVNQRKATFWAAGQLLGEIDVPAGNGQPFMNCALPVSMQYRNIGTVVGTPMQVRVGEVHVDQTDISVVKPWSHVMAAMGQTGAQGQDGGTMGSTAKYTNSLAAGAGALMANATALAEFIGLGGQATALPTLAVGTDGILFSFYNPPGGVTQTPRVLYITGLKLQGCVTTVLAGNATPVIYAFAACFGHTTVSLAAVDAVATKGPRRIPIGFEVYPAAAAVGTLGSAGLEMKFDTPIVVNPNEFFAISAKNLGDVTTSGAITFLAGINSYYE
ncbi:MAG: hypothetical protein WC073_10840 [Sterolibacterium sp.]